MLRFLFSSALIGCAPRAPTVTAAPQAAPVARATLQATLVLEGANIVVLDPAPHIEPNRSIVADGERIVWIGPRGERPPTGDARVVDVTDQFVIAGLSDMHGHLPAEEEAPFGLQTYLELQLAAGVTSIRSMRGDPSHANVRAEIAAGTRAGPDLVLASVPVSIEVLSEVEAQGVVAEAGRDGADFVKLLGVGDAQSYRNLMGAARDAGIPVAGHMPPGGEVDLALELGQQSIEHLGGVLDAVRDDAPSAPAVAAALAQPSLFHCPTLHWYALRLGVYSPDAFADEAALGAIPAPTREAWDVALAERRAELPGVSAARHLEPISDRLEALRLLFEAGALLVVGPDSGGAYGLPGSAVHEEMRLFTEAGIPAADALRAATSHAATLRGALDEGAVQVGHIGNVSTVQLTVHRGRVAWEHTDS